MKKVWGKEDFRLRFNFISIKIVLCKFFRVEDVFQLNFNYHAVTSVDIQQIQIAEYTID